MFTPSFPYLGNQIIISSGRVTHHSYDDFIFLFGKKGVGISSPVTFTVDVFERAIINAPKVELGFKAETQGDPVLLGNKTVKQLGDLLDAIKDLSDFLTKITEAEPETVIPGIVNRSKLLSDTAKRVKTELQVNCLSKTTYTR